MTSDSGAYETELLLRVRSEATRAAAFDELFIALRKQVFGVCLHITGNTADADDALQETFMAVSAGLPRFRGDSRLSTWVHRIAICAAIRVVSRRRDAADVHDVDPPSRGGDPVLASELAAQIARAMDQLSADHRVVLSLFAVDELSHAQIAEILGIPEGTVWSRLHCARKRLSAVLGSAAP
ncbi:MAG: RNA polymerase sigma factor [Planctomycetes bacterium]|nr:RNA polymerase sigma factor [Planctomycetota bacterium]